MSYESAKAAYAALGVDVDAAMTRLQSVPVSLHCWQGDDVRGFDTDPGKPLTGGIQTTGNYPGRARTPEELMADIDEVLKLCPGTKKINLHASYAVFEDGDWADRDKLEPRHFAKWVEFCKARGLGADFNPTFFSHPKCDPLTLSSSNEDTRRFWIEHGKACIRMKTYQAAVWAQHGLFASGPDFDITFGLAHTIEKAAEIYVKVLSAGQGRIRQTITDDALRAIAHDFGVTINEEFLD